MIPGLGVLTLLACIVLCGYYYIKSIGTGDRVRILAT